MVDEFVTGEMPLDQINEAFHLMHAGKRSAFYLLQILKCVSQFLSKCFHYFQFAVRHLVLIQLIPVLHSHQNYSNWTFPLRNNVQHDTNLKRGLQTNTQNMALIISLRIYS